MNKKLSNPVNPVHPVSNFFCYYWIMKFIVLGSGTSVPHPKRSSSAYWLETEKGSVLLDCSASAMRISS
jgi:hypothetical protein